MADYDAIVKDFEEYIEDNDINFEELTNVEKSEKVSNYIKTMIPADEKPDVIRTINEEYSGKYLSQGRYLNNSFNICAPNIIYDDSEIFVYLLKRLQSGENTDLKIVRADVADELGISPQSLDKYLLRLKSSEGLNLFGHTIRIDLRHGKNTYDNTIHPVSLTLNLTEVYFLTVLLPCILKGEKREIALDIAEDVYSQLSDYATAKIDSLRTIMGYPISNSTRERLPKDAPGYRKEKDSLHYFHKNRATCSIEFKDGVKVSGVISFFDPNDGRFQITEAGTGKIITFNEDDVNTVKKIPNSI